MKVWIVQFLCCLALLTSANPAQEAFPVKEPAVVSVALKIEPRKLDFGSQAVDTPSAPVMATLSNASAAVVRLLDITASGIDFSETNNCGEAIQPGTACEIQVVFRPAITGTRFGVLSVIVSNPGTPYYVGLTGVGQ